MSEQELSSCSNVRTWVQVSGHGEGFQKAKWHLESGQKLNWSGHGGFERRMSGHLVMLSKHGGRLGLKNPSHIQTANLYVRTPPRRIHCCLFKDCFASVFHTSLRHEIQRLYREFWDTNHKTLLCYYTRFLSVVPRTCLCDDSRKGIQAIVLWLHNQHYN
jgi:hypothetical protein